MNATRKHVHRKISSACNLGIISKKLLRQPWSPRALLYTHVWQLIPRSGLMLKPLVNKCPANRFYDHSVSVFFNKNQESKHSLIYVMYYSYRCECASVCVRLTKAKRGALFRGQTRGRRHPAEDCPTARAGARRGFEARPAPGRPGSEGERAGGQGGAVESAAGHAVRGWTPATDRAVTADV